MTFIVNSINKGLSKPLKAFQLHLYCIAFIVGLACLVEVSQLSLPLFVRQMLSGFLPMIVVAFLQLGRVKFRSRKEKRHLWMLIGVGGITAFALILLTLHGPWVCMVQFVLFVFCAIGVFRFRIRPLFLLVCCLLATYLLVV